MFRSIPIIDLSNAQTPEKRAHIARDIDAACCDSGFFVITGHGIPDRVIADQFTWAQRFFHMPTADKQAVSLFNSPARRGWEALGDQTLDEDAAPDQKESFYCGPEHASDHPYVVAGYDSYGSNQWPANLPGFADQMLTYIDHQTRLALSVLTLMAEGLSLPTDWFTPYFTNPMVTLRLLRYPPHPDNAPPNLFGAGAHTDWGGITLLAQDDKGGLEVRNPAGEWVPCPPVSGSFVVNLGDMIPRWTNDRYRSTPHRVINANAQKAERYSIPFFFSPHFEARIECIPTCRNPDGSANYPPCTAGEHMKFMYEKTYGLAS